MDLKRRLKSYADAPAGDKCRLYISNPVIVVKSGNNK
jgi:hypothetical protein